MMNYDSFLEKYYSTSSSVKHDDVTRFLDNLNELAEGKDVCELLSNHNFLCRLFFLSKSNNVCRSHYQKIKEYIANLLDYYNINVAIPTRVDVINSQEMSCYFEDLPAILGFIDKIGRKNLSDYNEHQDLIIVKSIVVLGWYGFSSKEIAEMPKGHLEYGDICKIYKVSPPGAFVNISRQAFLVLSDLETLQEYRGMRGKLLFMKGNPNLLFRPVRDGQPDLDEGHIVQFIKRFNNLIPIDNNVVISFKSLHKNAKFVDIYEDQTDDSLLTKIAKHMNCSRNAALSYRDQYCKWVEIFHKQ